MTVHTMLTAAAVADPAPTKSKRPWRRAVSVTSPGTSRRTVKPIGTLTNIVHRQDTRSVSAPPSIRPSAAPPDEMTANAARARLRAASFGALVAIRASTDGADSAAPTPCNARDVTSSHGAWAKPAGERGEREQAQAGHEDAAPAQHVSQTSAEQQQAAEGEAVGVEHPRQRGRAEMQIRGDVRQGDVHDRGIQHEHQLTDEHDPHPDRRVAAHGPGWHGPSEQR